MKQVDPVRYWPSGNGKTVAVLRDAPSALARRYGLAFEEGIDGLGEYWLAAIEDDTVHQMWFFAHKDAPEPGTEVQVDAKVPDRDAISALQRQLRLGPKYPAAVVWTSTSATSA
jgi:hypothetical protein